jgi:O-antigen ligase
VLLSRSRGGIVCTVTGLVVATVLTPRRHGASSTRRMLVAAGVLAALYGASLGLGPVVGRFAQLGGREAAIRPALWRDALSMVPDFPVAGVGAGAFGSGFPAYRRRLTAQVGFAHAHEDYLQLAIETGVPGLLLALAATVGFVRVVRAPLAGRLGAPTALLCGGIAAVLVHAAFDFPLHIPGIVFLLLLLAAAALALARAARLDKPSPGR